MSSAIFAITLFTFSVVTAPLQGYALTYDIGSTYDLYDSVFYNSSGGGEVGGLVGHVFLGSGGTTSDQGSTLNTSDVYTPSAILTSTIRAGASFNRLFHNGNPTIWGPYDNEVDALSIEYVIGGDLIFAVNFEGTVDAPYSFDMMEIWIPPEFQGIMKNRIVASFTNDWGNIGSPFKPEVDAQIVPNHWTRIRVNSDSSLEGLTTGRYIQFGNETLGDVWVYVRVNNVIAPTIAGKYFFKMGLRVATPIPSNSSTNVNPGEMIWLGSPEKPYQTFLSNGVSNWPEILVNGEIDPAYVEGTLRYGGYSGSQYYGQPLQLPGRVRVVGRAIDPFTLQPTGRPTEARGYFNASANGQFKVEGVAPGIYDIYASAAGYPERLIQANVQILKGQSYHLDGYLAAGVVIEGEVFSKCGAGSTNWVTWQNNPTDDVSRQDIKIEIYRLGEAGARAVTWSPVSSPARFGSSSGLTDNWGEIAIGFPWPGYGGKYARGFDPDGVGPAQKWQVSNTQTSFRFRFGDKGLYGTPALFSGHVPQLNATWIDGLPAGEYEVRAFTYGYVETKADGVTFEHVTFNVPAQEGPGAVYVPFDLSLSPFIGKTVHFHDLPETSAEKPIPGSGEEHRYLHLEAIDDAGAVWGWKVDSVSAGSTSATIYSRGIRGQTMSYWGSGSGINYGFNAGNYVVKAYMYGYVEDVASRIPIGLCGSEIRITGHMYRGVMFNVTFQSTDWQHPTTGKSWKYPDEYIYLQIWKDGKQLAGYGLNGMPGFEFWAPDGDTYTHDGQTQPFGITGSIRSAYRIKQGDYVINKLGENWSSTQSSFAMLYYEGQEAYKHTDPDVGYYPTSFESGLYELAALTYGYVMPTDSVTGRVKTSQVYATKGSVINIPIRLSVGAQISLTMRFTHEQIFESLRYDSTVRVRVFDDNDNLVGEWLTSSPFSSSRGVLQVANYVPRGTNLLKVTISGLPDPYTTGSGSLYASNGFDRVFDVSPWRSSRHGVPGAPYGINGYPLYAGGYYVEVEVVPFGNEQSKSYPPVPGLLNGESCAGDLRTGVLYEWSIVENHIGPYQPWQHISLSHVYMSGESGAVVNLELFGSVGIPIPEYPEAAFVLGSTLLAGLLVLRHRRKRPRPHLGSRSCFHSRHPSLFHAQSNGSTSTTK